MKKKRYLWLMAVIALLFMLIIIIKKGMEKKLKEELAITAMYVPFGKGSHVFIEIEDRHNVFSVYVKDGDCRIYDMNGKKIEFHQLVKGNVVKIYGDGMMQESYPGGYPGVTEMRVVKEGSPADADIYQDIIDGIYTEPDPAEPPSMNVTYTTGMMSSAAILTRGSYTWNYVDADGVSKTAEEEKPHVLQWGEELNDIQLSVPTDLTLDFYDRPQQVEVIRYSRSLLGTEDIPDGEKAAVVQKNEDFVIESASGDYVYSITGIWENGRVEFGFMTSSK